MIKDLLVQLNHLPDPRRRAGMRHPVGLVVLLAIMATVSGMSSYRAMGDFVQANREELLSRLGVEKGRLPGYSTIRRVLIGLPTEEFSQVLGRWNRAGRETGESYKWVHLDGKAIKGTGERYRENNQDFVNVVSLFFEPARLVLASSSFHNKEQSEIKVVADLGKKTDLEGVVFTADALHAQKNGSRHHPPSVPLGGEGKG